jgi:hypothetical protein
MLDGPLQLLNRDKYFSEAGVDFCFPTVKAAGSHYGFLMIEDVSQKGLEESAALREGRTPGALRCRGTLDSHVDVRWGGRLVVAKKTAICRAFAFDQVTVRREASAANFAGRR